MDQLLKRFPGIEKRTRQALEFLHRVRWKPVLVRSTIALTALWGLFVYQNVTGFFFPYQYDIPKDQIQHYEGEAYRFKLPGHAVVSNRAHAERKVYEDGEELYSKDERKYIMDRGNGSWLGQGENLYFSSLDGAPPSKNDSDYEVTISRRISDELYDFVFWGAVLLWIIVVFYQPARQELRRHRREVGQVGAVLFGLWVIAEAWLYRGEAAWMVYFRRDSAGYLGAALSLLEEGTFDLSWKRHYGYPAFLTLVLAIFHNINGILLVQRIISCASALLLFLTVRRLQPTLTGTYLGIFAAHLFLQSPAVIVNEQSIMGECLCHFLICTTIFLSTRILTHRGEQGPWGQWLLLCFSSSFIYFVKPNYGFGIGIPVLVAVGYLLLHPGRFWRPAVLAGLSFVVISGTLLGFDKASRTERDDSSSFSMQVAFLWHLNIIAPYLEEDLAEGTHPHMEAVRGILKAYKEEVERCKNGGKNAYPRIGYDPDNLIRGDMTHPTDIMSNQGMSAEEQDAFLKSYLLRSVRESPGGWVGQTFDQFQYWGRPEWCSFASDGYVSQGEFLRASKPLVRRFFSDSAIATAYRQSLDKLLNSAEAKSRNVIISREYGLFKTMGKVTPYILVLALLVAPLTLILSRRKWRAIAAQSSSPPHSNSEPESPITKFVPERLRFLYRSRTLPPSELHTAELALLSLILTLGLFAILLTQALIHSLAVGRYSELVYPLTISAIACSFLLFLDHLMRTLPHVVRYLRPKLIWLRQRLVAKLKSAVQADAA